MTLLRPSTADDISAITAIYAHHVLYGTGTFETEPPAQAEMARRREEVLGRGLPWLVAAEGGEVLGFAYCNWFKPRPAYRYSAEDSIYIAPHRQAQGLGRALLAELAAQAERRGVRKLIAVIGDSFNTGSIGLHHTLGFAQVGVIASCGWKFGRWLDIVLMEKSLGLSDSCTPETASPCA